MDCHAFDACNNAFCSKWNRANYRALIRSRHYFCKEESKKKEDKRTPKNLFDSKHDLTGVESQKALCVCVREGIKFDTCVGTFAICGVGDCVSQFLSRQKSMLSA